MVFSQCTHRLHPITRIQVFDSINNPGFSFMDMAADDPVAAFGSGHFCQFFLVLIDIRNGRFYLSLYILGKREIGKSALAPVMIDQSIKPKEKGVAYISHVSDPSKISRDAVENISVCDEVFFAIALINHIRLDR